MIEVGQIHPTKHRVDLFPRHRLRLFSMFSIIVWYISLLLLDTKKNMITIYDYTINFQYLNTFLFTSPSEKSYEAHSELLTRDN